MRRPQKIASSSRDRLIVAPMATPSGPVVLLLPRRWSDAQLRQWIESPDGRWMLDAKVITPTKESNRG